VEEISNVKEENTVERSTHVHVDAELDVITHFRKKRKLVDELEVAFEPSWTVTVFREGVS
jgi:hypothetical protein